jgi:MFS family permease
VTFIAPGQIRAQATAVYFLVINLTGQAAGPPLVGLLADHFGGPQALAAAMTIEAFAVGLPALLLVALGLRHYRRLAASLELSAAEPRSDFSSRSQSRAPRA